MLTQRALDHLPGAFGVVDAEGRLRFWNERLTELAGYDDAALEGAHLSSLIAADDREALTEAMRTVLTEDRTVQLEVSGLPQSGAPVPLMVTGGRVILEREPCIVGMAQDISRRKAAEADLRAREKQYRLLATTITDAVTRHRPDTTCTYASPSIEALTGYAPDEVVGQSTLDLVHPDDRDRVEQRLENLLRHEAEELRVQFRLQRRDGTIVWVESRGQVVSDEDEAPGYIASTRDISARKERESALEATGERLARQRERLHLLYNIVADQDRPVDEQLERVVDLLTTTLNLDAGAIYRLDESGDLVLEVGGWASDDVRDELIGRVEHDTGLCHHLLEAEKIVTWHDVTEEEDQPCCGIEEPGQFVGAPLILDSTPYGTLCLMGRQPRSAPFDAEDRAFLRTVIRWVEGALKDRRQRRQLQRNKQLLEKAESVADLGGFVMDPASDTLKWTEQLRRLAGMEEAYEPSIGGEWEIIPEQERERVRALLQEALTTGQGQRFELQIAPKTGERKWVEISLEAERDGRAAPSDAVERETDQAGLNETASGPPYQLWGVVQDITERKRREEVLRRAKEEAERSERLKSAFLANFSHEVRTPLTSMIGFAEVIAEETDPEVHGELHRFAQMIEQSGQRLRKTFQSVLRLSRMEAEGLTPPDAPVDLSAETDEVCAMLRSRAEEKGVTLHVDTESGVQGPWPSDALHRILDNLVGNAIKYTSDAVHVRVYADGDGGVLEVEDNGPGIPDSFQDQLFEPFTRGPEQASASEGAGLGLSITARFVEALGGTINVETEEGAGTCFTVRLPPDPEKKGTSSAK